MSENSESRCVAEPPTDLTDEEWEYIRYVGGCIVTGLSKPLSFNEWKAQRAYNEIREKKDKTEK